MKLRAGTKHKAINPTTGRVITTEGAKKKAWEAFARYIRARDPYCITCGHPTTEAGHFLHNTDKENKKLGGNELWYDEQNVHGQEFSCNRGSSGKLAKYAARLEEMYGPGIISTLYRKFNTPRTYTIPELLEIAAKYERKLRELDTDYPRPDIT